MKYSQTDLKQLKVCETLQVSYNLPECCKTPVIQFKYMTLLFKTLVGDLQLFKTLPGALVSLRIRQRVQEVDS